MCDEYRVPYRETGHDPAVHGAKLEDRFYNNDAFKNPSVDPSNPQQQDAAVKIQTQVRQHQAVKEVLSKEEEEAAEKIQAGFRGYSDRQKVLQMKDPEEYERRQKEIEARLAASKTQEEEEVDIDLNDPEVEKAAVKIQAGFKGFKARKEVKDSQTKPKEEDSIDIDLNDPEVSQAALKIQAGFRGHKTRQEVKTLKAKREEEEDIAAIDLTDPDLANAALKIQSSFRGFKSRKVPVEPKDEEEEESRLDNGGETNADGQQKWGQPPSESRFSWFGFRRSSSLKDGNRDDIQPKSTASDKRRWWSLLRQPSNIFSVLNVSTTTQTSSSSSWYSTSSEYGSGADTLVRPRVQRAVGFFRNILQGLRGETFSEDSSEDVENVCDNVINEQVETLSWNSSSGYTDSSSSQSVVKRQHTVPAYTPSTLPSKHWVDRPAQSMDEFYEHIATTNQAIRRDIHSQVSVSLDVEAEKVVKKSVISALWDNVNEAKVKKRFPPSSDKKFPVGNKFKLAAKQIISRFRERRVCYRIGIHHCTADLHVAPDFQDSQTSWFSDSRLSDVTVDTNVRHWLNQSVFNRMRSVSSVDLTDPTVLKYILLLQGVFRSRLVKKYWRKNPENSLSLVKACLLIQSVFRSRLIRKKYEKFRKVQNNQINMKNPKLRKSCIFIQSVIRLRLKEKASGYSNRNIKSVPLEKNNLNYDLIKSCLMIQTQFRSNLAHKLCLRENSEMRYSIRDASVLIQSAFRNKLAMKQLSSYLDWINRSSSSESNNLCPQGSNPNKMKNRHISWDPFIPNDTGVEKISLTKQYFMKKKLRGSIVAMAQDPKLLRACLLIQSMFRSKLSRLESSVRHQESSYKKQYLTDQNVQRAIETIQFNVRRVLKPPDEVHPSASSRSVNTSTKTTIQPIQHRQDTFDRYQYRQAFSTFFPKSSASPKSVDPKLLKAALIVQAAFRDHLHQKNLEDPPTPTNTPTNATEFFPQTSPKKSPLHVGISQRKNLDQDEDEDETDSQSSDSPCAANEIDLEWSNVDVAPRFPLLRQNTVAGVDGSPRSVVAQDLKKQYSVDSYIGLCRHSFYDPLSLKPREFEYFEPRLPRSNITLQKIRQSSQSFSRSEEKFDYFDPKLRKATQLLQNAFRSHTARKRMKEQWFSQKYSLLHKRADDSGVNPIFRRAVVLIQAAFREKMNRKLMKSVVTGGDNSFATVGEYYTKNTAAKVIQSAYMKHLTRRLLNQTIEQRIQAKHTALHQKKLEHGQATKQLVKTIFRRHSSLSSRRLSQQDSSTLKAILMIQSVFRYRLIHREKAALLIQNAFRTNLVLKAARKEKPVKPKRFKDHVVLLQTAFRRRLFLKVIGKMEMANRLDSSPDAVIRRVVILQALCRTYFHRKRKREHAIRLVQSVIRRRIFTNVVFNLKVRRENRVKSTDHIIRNVVYIQSFLRCFITRKQRLEKAVKLVQAAFRRKLLLKIIHQSERKQDPKSILRSVYILQQFVRIYLERKERFVKYVTVVQAACRRKLFEKCVLENLGHHGLRSVVMVQSAFRDQLLRPKMMSEEEKKEKITLIQNAVREKLDKGLVEKAEAIVKQVLEEERERRIIMIQSAIRYKLDQKVRHQAESIVNDVLDIFRNNSESLTTIIEPKVPETELTEKKKLTRVHFSISQPVYSNIPQRTSLQEDAGNVIKLQSIIRVHLMIKRRRQYTEAVKLLQNAFRQRLLLKLLEQQKLLNAVLLLQNAFRRHVVLKTVPKDSTPEVYRSAIFLQSMFRSRLACDEKNKMTTAAKLIQDEYRKRLLMKTINKDPVKRSNVVCLQSSIRSRLAQKQNKEMEKAACTVQTAFRKHKFIQIAKSKTRSQDEEKLLRASQILQTAFRRKLLLRDMSHGQDERMFSVHTDHILLLQKAFRRKLLLKSLLMESKPITPKQKYTNYVILIQTIIRRKLHQKHFEKTHLKTEDTRARKTSALESFFEKNMTQLRQSSLDKPEKRSVNPFFGFLTSKESSVLNKAGDFLKSSMASLVSSPKQRTREEYIILIQSAIRAKMALKKMKLKIKSDSGREDNFDMDGKIDQVILMQSAFRKKLSEKKSSVILIHPISRDRIDNIHQVKQFFATADEQRLILKIQAAFRQKLLQKRRLGISDFFKREVEGDVFLQHVRLIQAAVRTRLMERARFEKAVVTIQSGFRRHLLPELSPVREASMLSEIQLERAALLLQSAFRAKLFSLQKSTEEDTFDDSSSSSANTVEYLGEEQDLRKSDVFLDTFTRSLSQPYTEQEEAALLLQAAFRRHLHFKKQKILVVQAAIRRKLLLNLVNNQRDKYGPVRTDLLCAHLMKATVMMQSAFRNRLKHKEKSVKMIQTACRNKLFFGKQKSETENISDVENAAIILQAAFRGHLSQNKPESKSPGSLLDVTDKIRSAILIQKAFRRYQKQKLKHVLLLQGAFRKRLFLKESAHLQKPESLDALIKNGTSKSTFLKPSDRNMNLKSELIIRSVLHLQSAIRYHFRQKQEREKHVRLLQAAFRQKLLQKLVEMAYGIPAGAGGDQMVILSVHLVKGIRLIQTAFIKRLAEKEKSVRLLQSAFRRRLLMKVADNISQPGQQKPEQLLRAIILLQSAFRRRAEQKEEAAMMIQTAFRKKILMDIVSEIEQKVNKDTPPSPATNQSGRQSVKVQVSPTIAVLKATLLLQKVFRRNLEKREKAVLMVQSAFRGKILLRLHHRARSLREIELWVKTITLIQSSFRHHLRQKERHVILLQTAFRKRLFMNVALRANRQRQNMSVEQMERLIRGIFMVQTAIRYHTQKKEECVRLIQDAFRRKLLEKVANHSLSLQTGSKTGTNAASGSLSLQHHQLKVLASSAKSYPSTHPQITGDQLQYLKANEHHILILQRVFRQKLLQQVTQRMHDTTLPLPVNYVQSLIRGIILIQTAWRRHLEVKERAAKLIQEAFRRRLLIKVAERIGPSSDHQSPETLVQLLNAIRKVQRVFRYRLKQNEKAALLIQAAFRKRLLMKVTGRIVDEPDPQEAEILLRRIVMVQSAIRRHNRQKVAACLLLQSAFRRRLLLKLANNVTSHPSTISRETKNQHDFKSYSSAISGQTHNQKNVSAPLSQTSATNLLRGVILLQSAFKHHLQKQEQGIRLLQAAYRKHQLMKVSQVYGHERESNPDQLIRAILLVQSAFRNQLRNRENAARLVQEAYRRNAFLKTAKLAKFSKMVPQKPIDQLQFERSIHLLQAAFRRHLLLKLSNDLKDKTNKPCEPEKLLCGILLVQTVFRQHLHQKEVHVRLLQAAFRRRLLLKVMSHLPPNKQQQVHPENLIRGILLVQSSIRNHLRTKERGVRLLQAAFRKRLLMNVACQISNIHPQPSAAENRIRGVILFQSVIRHKLHQKHKAVVMVQTAFRIKLLQKVTMMSRTNKFRDYLRIERLIGGIILFQTAIRNHRRRKLEAALMIQTVFRRKLLLKVVEKANINTERKQPKFPAPQTNITKTTKQTPVLESQPLPADLKISKTIRAVSFVQSVIRRHLQQREQKIIKIQSLFRRRLIMKIAQEAFNTTQSLPPICVVHLSKAIIRIQTIFRLKLKRKEASVLLVQAAFRRHLLMKVALMSNRTDIPPTQLLHSIIMVQTIIRQKIHRRKQSTIMIQALVRRALMLKLLKTVHQENKTIQPAGTGEIDGEVCETFTKDTMTEALQLLTATRLIQTSFRRSLERREKAAKMLQNAFRTRLLLNSLEVEEGGSLR